MKLNQVEVQHFLLRMGFGDPYSKVRAYIGSDPRVILGAELARTPDNMALALPDEDTAILEDIRNCSVDVRPQKIRDARPVIKSINKAWIQKMVSAPSGLPEKMAYFWHDHFSCSSSNAIFMYDYVNTLRTHALGNFGDLLRAVSKEPAMLRYLNNQQNRKHSPNENFAREVMELFTLGRDNVYSESDIREAARAFTGWGFNREGKFVFRKRVHDQGGKTILGRTGDFDGDDVIDILLERRETAQYIAQKWVKYFATPEGNPALEEEVARALYDSGYDIRTGLTALCTDRRFYELHVIARRIKSPIELIVGMQRMFHVTVDDQDSLLYLQKTLGQRLGSPPNVAGWPDGTAWVDNATLTFRLLLPQHIFRAAMLSEPSLASYDDNDPFGNTKRLKKLQAVVDYDQLTGDFDDVPSAQRVQFMLQEPPTDIISGDASLIDQVLFYTAKPEFQLC